MNEIKPTDPLKPADFATDQEVRWCPGCGDYAILKAMQGTLAEIEARPESTVFISGIGCSSRFPYYMNTYGFHSIHGRALPIATGTKMANPDLDVWVITGDGDGLSIGGNHLLHTLRRNIDLQIILFNNEIYGLTKGQYSPTSPTGMKSPSSPMGSVEHPVSPALLALGAEARFIARGVDTDRKHLQEVFKRAHAHKGSSFVEIFQNCLVYNDAIFEHFTDKKISADRQVHVEHGKPLIYGKENDKGLRMSPDALRLEAVTIGENGVTLDDILVHDETDSILATLLSGNHSPDFPVALGVLYCNPKPSFEAQVMAQIDAAVLAADGNTGLNDLLRRGYTWTID